MSSNADLHYLPTLMPKVGLLRAGMSRQVYDWPGTTAVARHPTMTAALEYVINIYIIIYDNIKADNKHYMHS